MKLGVKAFDMTFKAGTSVTLADSFDELYEPNWGWLVELVDEVEETSTCLDTSDCLNYC